MTLLLFGSLFAQPCSAPGIYGVANITQTSAYLQWIAGTPSNEWQILVLPGTAEPPTNESTGWISTTVNPYIVTGLTCNTQYKFYVRNVCSTGVQSDWSVPGFFTTWPCDGLLPDINVCDNGTGTVDAELGANNGWISMFEDNGGLSFSYHLSQADAESNVNPLLNPYTVSQPTSQLFVRSYNSFDDSFTVYPFNLNIVQPPVLSGLIPYVICSDSGFAAFNLDLVRENLIASSEGMDNTIITFHETMEDAESGFGQVLSPYTNEVALNQTLYIRVAQGYTGCVSVSSINLVVPPCSGFEFTAFVDQNTNGVLDAGEPPFSLGSFNYQMNDGIVHEVASSDGTFEITDSAFSNSYDVSFTISPEFASYYSSSVTFSDLVPDESMASLVFPIVVSESYKDASVSIVSFNQPRPGFTYTEYIVVKNNGPMAYNGTLTFNNFTLEIVATTPGVTDIPGGFTLNIADLPPFATMHIAVEMQVPVIPIVMLGDQLVSTASISAEAGDIDPENNNASNASIIVGSYDPNDKMEAHGGQILIDNFTSDDYLYYTIRFENTGTAAALNVRITDELDSMIDAQSVRMIDASHDYFFERIGNQLVWNFNDIMLPHSSQDPEGAKGYVHFKIKLNQGFEEGDIVPNTAVIFFDFNPPIITNTFNTEFVNQLAVGENNTKDFTIYPNPASSMLNVIANGGNAIKSIRLIDIAGKSIMSQTVSASQTLIDVSFVRTGMYFLQVELSSGIQSVRKIVIE